MATALAVVAVTVAGCSSASTTLGRAEFITQADRICTAANAKISHVAPPPSSAPARDVATYTQTLLGIVPPAVDRLAALKAAPADVATLDQNLLAPLRALDAARQMLVANVQEANGDAATEEAALEYFAGSGGDPDQAAHNEALTAFGFRACPVLGGAAAGAGNGATGPATPAPGATPPTTILAAPGNTAPPASGANQTPFVATDAGFRAVFPAPPTRHAGPLENDVILQSIFYAAATAGEDVSVTYSLHPTAPPAGTMAAVLDDGVQEAAAAISGVVTTMTPITYLGSPAEDAVITTSDQVDHLRIVVIGAKFYVLQGFTAVTDTAHPGYDELVASFHTI
jgi:hypothetical protein